MTGAQDSGLERTNYLAHAIIWIGIAITAFPLWVAFVASTIENQAIAQAPMTLIPGGLGPRSTRASSASAATTAAWARPFR